MWHAVLERSLLWCPSGTLYVLLAVDAAAALKSHCSSVCEYREKLCAARRPNRCATWPLASIWDQNLVVDREVVVVLKDGQPTTLLEHVKLLPTTNKRLCVVEQATAT
jgi:hypothetical protein